MSLPGWAENPYAFMSRAALFVLSSRHEGFPGVLIEALACGCPTASTDCPAGPSEILEDAGLLAPVGDAGGAGTESCCGLWTGLLTKRRSAPAPRVFLWSRRWNEYDKPDCPNWGLSGWERVKMAKFAVSVLTPTYNRAQILHRVFDSLNRQKVRDFEWVVVDDGSTDDTPALLAKWQTDADFPITWFRYNNNRGKHAAINVGRKLVSGDYTLRLDSDDALVDDAMETIAAWRAKTEIDSIPKVCGLVFRCVDDLGNIVGKLKNSKS